MEFQLSAHAWPIAVYMFVLHGGIFYQLFAERMTGLS